MIKVVRWDIENRGLAVRMTRQCGCEVQWNSSARVDDEWVIYPCFDHAGTRLTEELRQRRIVEESRALELEL